MCACVCCKSNKSYSYGQFFLMFYRNHSARIGLVHVRYRSFGVQGASD